MRRLRIALLIGSLVVAAAVAQESPQPQEADKAGEPVETGSVWDEVVRLYEAARESGEQVPKDVYDWVRGDLASIGSWEYHVETVSGDDATLEARLAELGADRWELVGFRAVSGTAVRLVLKRPNRTYLNKVPLGELLKLVPISSEDGS